MGLDFVNTVEQLEDLMGMSLVASLVSEIPSMLINLAVYVFTALAIYTIAKRRGIKNPWLAWIPFANSWLLGCISDQYRDVARGETKNRRRVLLWTQIGVSAVGVMVMVLVIVMLVNILGFGIGSLENLEYMSEADAAELLGAIMGPVLGMVVLALAMVPLGIVYAVFYFIALNDIYKSCEPANATLYLVLSIFISYAQPVFLFMCRNKDGGMPQRQVPPTVYEPFEQPAEPWEKTEE